MRKQTMVMAHGRWFGPMLLALVFAAASAVNATETKAPTTAAPKAEAAQPAGRPPATQPPKAMQKKAAPAKHLDINSASRSELKSLPGIGDAEADKIIAGRPWLTKADLVIEKVLPEGVYVAIKDRMVAKQTRKPPQKK